MAFECARQNGLEFAEWNENMMKGKIDVCVLAPDGYPGWKLE